MELDRKAFHFDLDNESVERFYTGKKNGSVRPKLTYSFFPI